MSIYENYYQIGGVKQHKEFEAYLERILFDKEERERFYREILKINNDVSVDTFKPYFEEYAAERKSNQQDYTPDSVAKILASITRGCNNADYSGYDMTAGTGTLIIQKWWDDMNCETPFTYAPHRYLYKADELSDSAIIYLIHNLALRGMNALVIHGDVLEGTTKNIYFIQNGDDDYLHFSDINVMPRTDDIAREFSVSEWIGEPIEHIESQEVILNFAYPSIKEAFEVDYSNKPFEGKGLDYYHNRIKLKDVAYSIERSKKNRIYPKNSIIIQLSATSGQVGLLKSNGKVGTQYAVVILENYINPIVAFEWLKIEIPRFFRRVQEGLNVKIEEIGNCAFPILKYNPYLVKDAEKYKCYL